MASFKQTIGYVILIGTLYSSASTQLSPSTIERVDNLFPVSIIHINDFHARFEETNEASTGCRKDEGQKCIGGYARAVTVVKQLLELRKNTNPIYLNAGDNFQGTIWYNIGRWNVTSYFLNMLKADAIVLGNHDFDNAIEGVVPFIETLESPVIVSNMDDSEEPTIQGIYQHSIIIDRYDRKIGIIGVILSTTDQIASTGRLKFLDESETVRAEASKLKSQGVNIIIVLSHCGLDVDYKIARNAGPDIDVIVGGHSHTFMFTGDNPPGPDRPQDNYPAVVTQEDGHRVLIVQASAYTKYIGDLTVYFDENGLVKSWEGYPIYLDSDIVQDPDIVREIQPWKEIIDVESLRVIGTSKVTLQKSNCNYQECNIGNFVTDSFVYHYVGQSENSDEWTYAAVSVINVGGIRTTLDTGILTYGDLVTTLPFENILTTMELSGKIILEMLEYSVSKSYDEDRFNGMNMLQVSGLQIVYNVTNSVGQRVVSVNVLCNKCEVPKYAPLDPTETYRIIVQSYMANGGDGFTMMAHGQNVQNGPIDVNAFTDYVARMSPIVATVSGRITVLE